MRMLFGHLYRKYACRSSNIAKRGIAREVELSSQCSKVAGGDTRHCINELLQTLRFIIKRFKHRMARMFHFILRLSCEQGFIEVGPETIEAVVGHLQRPADVGWLVLIQEYFSLGGVGILC